MTSLAILADDLTGACDTGSLFTGGGTVPVTVWPEVAPAAPAAPVRVTDTESRPLPVDEAATRVSRAAGAGPAMRYFKKIDSTLRGRIGAEVEALMAASGATLAVVSPAFPAQRRLVVDGELLVDGVPVATSGVHATSSVINLLRPQVTGALAWLSLAEVRAGGEALGARLRQLHGVVVADAETDDDLDILVAAALSLDAAPLLVGAAGLARALAARLGVLCEHVDLPRTRRWLLIAGSLHPATRGQVQAARDAGLAVIATAPATGADDGAAARRLAEEAGHRLRTERVEVVVVTGGDTAVALYEALGRGRLELVGPPAPGLALARLTPPDRDALWLVTKAGGFGDPELIVSLAKEAA